MRVQGKTALVTGASGGIGAAIARRLAAEGARLVLSGRRAEALAALSDELEARVVTADLAERSEVGRLADAAGRVDVLVANAALPGSGRLSTYLVDEIDRALNVNLRAPIVLAHALAPAMAARGEGHLVFMSSLSGKAATAYASIYDATKFGLRGFALALRAELRTDSVGVSAIFPGFVSEAGMFADANVELPPGVRTRSPEQVAAAVVRAIERNKAEIDVAPWSMRAGAVVAGMAPDLAALVTRLTGGERIGRAYEVAQRDKR